ncbi:MAG TPA: hypothetical protein VG122_14575 [Gemmata sp.]|jgi:hypothetical protein|nr:hypothetical protein [Gemmata sp.]
MKWLLASLVACFVVAGSAKASQPSGIYAHVTKVEFVPEGAKPEDAREIKIHGEFIMVEIDGMRSDVKAGYLHFSLPEPKAKAALCRTEWADLAEIAALKDEVIGKEDDRLPGRYVAFGSAYAKPNYDFSISRVHAPGSKSTIATAYPLNAGLVRLRTSHRLEESKSPVLDFQKYRQEKPGDKK